MRNLHKDFQEECQARISNYPNSEIQRTDALDRFGTLLEKRFGKTQIQELLMAAGFRAIRFSDSQPHWCAIGIKNASDDRQSN